MSNSSRTFKRIAFSSSFRADKTKECGIRKSVKYGGEKIYICFENSSLPDNVNINAVLYFIANAFDVSASAERRFFYRDGEISFYLHIINGEGTISVAKVGNSIAQREAISFYEGQSFITVKESWKEIKKRSSKSLVVISLLLLAIVVLSLLFFYFFVVKDAQVVKKIPPKPHYPPLTSSEKIYLQNKGSVVILRKMIEEVEKFETKEAKLRDKRVVGFSFDPPAWVNPVEPVYNKDTNRWEWVNGEYPKSGGYSYALSTETLMSFAGINYRLDDEDEDSGATAYRKQDSVSFDLDERNITGDGAGGRSLSRFCLVNSLLIPHSSVTQERNKDRILILSKKVKPHDIIDKINILLTECPIFIESMRLEDGEMTVSFYLARDWEKDNAK